MNPDESTFSRSAFPHIKTIVPRWGDYDMLGHLNNVEYYRYFEFVILNYLESTPLDWVEDSVIPFVVESRCFFRKPIAYMADVHAGLRVPRIGNSSMQFHIGLFTNDDTMPSAYGYFNHVYINRETERPTPIPQGIVEDLKKISV